MRLELDEELSEYLARQVKLTGLSEQEVLEEALNKVAREVRGGRPHMRGVFRDQSIVGKHEELLEGLGE